ncbi:hypothetical protein Agabi119p4_6653 [Agaricus bisporus var. burnettii]|uniref:F-box domain-containing protein n=1 Tax=Agaricus bisporus var. burnettii TaxID=192524 RepID=A0A8H7EZZ2_AGABI|nr:hypothetical protein Agabi119p4_6653 [Agaricus bisporus var. burnettii]
MITALNASSPLTVRVRSETLRILNATQSRTRSLPSEVLSIIFQHACPTPDILAEQPGTQMPPFHLVLRLVSASWYNTVQLTPRLWTSVFLPDLCTENVDIQARYLKLCLENSGSLPLTLSFRFDEELWNISWSVSPIVDAILECSAHRIQALRLLRPPRTWLEKLIPKMCQLATIHIDNPRRDLPWSPDKAEERFYLPTSAKIRQIYIRCPSLVDFRFECTMPSATHGDFIDCPIDIAIEFLLKCPNVIDFGCRFLLPPIKVQNPHNVLKSPLILSHLSTFSWSTNRSLHGISEWDRALFNFIHFPALKRFNWWVGRGLACYHLEADDAFLSRFPQSVTVLELGAVALNPMEESLHHFFPLTGVTQLQLRHCEYAFLEEAFSVLSRGTDRNTVLFPKLTSMIIDHRVFVEVEPPWVVFQPESGKALAQMLRTRIGLIDEFKLIVQVAHLTRRWNEESWQALREVMRDGLDLTIIEHGLPVIII